jgi:hypothetical protein
MTENGGAPSPMDVPVSVWTDFSGPVVSVLDCDTIEVLHNTRAERIRFNGIDCPEKGTRHNCRRAPTRWHQRQSHAGSRQLVLMVSEVCTKGYHTGAARAVGARGQERFVGGSAAGAALGVATVTSSRPLRQYVQLLRSSP